jgi:hypothetical protein
MRMAHSRICSVVPESNLIGTDDQFCNDKRLGTKPARLSIQRVQRELTRSEIGSNGYSARTGKAGEHTPGITSIVAGYGQMVQDRVGKGWSCDLLTFMFNPMVGSEASMVARMADQVQRVYSTFVTRTHRRPGSTLLDRLPLLIGAADLPVYKRKKTSSGASHQNSGLHFHGLLMVPGSTRLQTSVTQHLGDHASIYLGRDGLLQRIHSTEIKTNPGYMIEYVFKTVLKRRLPYDQAVLVLPECHLE